MTQYLALLFLRYGTYSDFPHIFQDFKDSISYQLLDPDVVLTHDILNKVREAEKLDKKDAEWREMVAMGGGRADGDEERKRKVSLHVAYESVGPSARQTCRLFFPAE